jgi:hypothetical protein
MQDEDRPIGGPILAPYAELIQFCLLSRTSLPL